LRQAFQDLADAKHLREQPANSIHRAVTATIHADLRSRKGAPHRLGLFDMNVAIGLDAQPCSSTVMGARGVQQLRQTAIELRLAPIRSSLHIPVATLWAHYTFASWATAQTSKGDVWEAMNFAGVSKLPMRTGGFGAEIAALAVAGTSKNAPPWVAIVGIRRLRSRNRFRISQLVSAISRQPWHAA
jgi:hypothetical protein